MNWDRAVFIFAHLLQEEPMELVTGGKELRTGSPFTPFIIRHSFAYLWPFHFVNVDIVSAFAGDQLVRPNHIAPRCGHFGD